MCTKNKVWYSENTGGLRLRRGQVYVTAHFQQLEGRAQPGAEELSAAGWIQHNQAGAPSDAEGWAEAVTDSRRLLLFSRQQLNKLSADLPGLAGQPEKFEADKLFEEPEVPGEEPEETGGADAKSISV